MKLHIKIVLTIIVTLLLLIYLAGFLPAFSQTPPNWVITGRIMAPSPETTASWIPVTNAIITLTDIEGEIHIVTTGEDGYYFFKNLAVDANSVITAIAIVNGKTMVLKDVIPEAVAAPKTYDAETADAKSTALALIVEELTKQGLTHEDIDLEIILESDNFEIVEEQVLYVLEDNGNIMDDIIVAGEEVESERAPEITGVDASDFTVTDEEKGMTYRVTVTLREKISDDDSIAGTAATYTITASFVGSGAIKPSGAVSVNNGSSQTFTITPKRNYHIVGITVDGALEVGPFVSPYTYTFTDVTNDHTIEAYLAIDNYNIAASVVGSGTIIPSGAVTVNHGADQTFTITPDPSYHILGITVDGALEVGPFVSPYTYTFDKVTEHGHSIVALFIVRDTYTITASVVGSGTIDPSGAVSVNNGSSQTFTITPDDNYHIDEVLVNGNPVEAVSSYTLDNVTRDHIISASFAIDTHKLTMYTDADGTGSGTVSPVAGVYTYNYGDKVNIKATAGTGSDFTYWLQNENIDDTTKKNTKVTMNGDQTVTASFTLKTYTLTMSVDGTGSGTVSPVAGVYIYNYGDEVTIGATPDTGTSTWIRTTVYIDSIFAGWSGDASGTGGVTLIMDSDKSVTATFDLQKVTLTMSVDGTGSGTVSPTVDVYTYNYGDKVNIKATAGTNSDFTYWLQNENIDDTTKKNTKVTMNGDQTVTAIFTLSVALNDDATLKALTVSAGTLDPAFASGTSSYNVELPYGTTTVPTVGATTSDPNASKEITQAKDVTHQNESQRTAKVLVTAEDGSTKLTYKVIFSVAPNTDATLSDLTVDGITIAGFSSSTYIYAVELLPGTTLVPEVGATTNASKETTQAKDVTHQNESQRTAKVLVTAEDGTELTYKVIFSVAINTYTITASTGDNGSISPSGATVNHGANQSFTITPATGYHIADVLVDGTTSLGAVSSYTFKKVTKDHTISATFAIDTHTITVSAGSGGSIIPSGDAEGNLSVSYGANQSFTITPATGYHIVDVLVDGTTSLGAVSSYTFKKVTKDHTISATFVYALDHFSFAEIGNQTAGVAFTITIYAKDSSGNTVTDYTGTNTLSVTDNTISPDSTTAFTAGEWTGEVTLNSVQTGAVITTAGGGKTGDSGSFDLPSGTLDHFTFDTIAEQTAGVAFAITITAKDSSGNTDIDYNGENTLTLSLTGKIKIIWTTPTAFTDGEWKVSVTITKSTGKKEKVVRIITSGDGKTGESNEFKVKKSHPKDKLLWVIQPAASVKAGDIWTAFTIEITDEFGNRTSDTDKITIAASGSGTLGGTLTQKAEDGLATFNNITYDKTETITITGSAKKLTDTPTSSSVSVTAGKLDHFDFVTIGEQIKDQPFAITITAKDSSGNTDIDYNGENTLTLSLTGKIKIIWTTPTAFTDGEWKVSVTITKSTGKKVVRIITSGDGKTGKSNDFKVKKK